MSGVTGGLRQLLGRLTAYRVDWKFSFVPTENMEYEPGVDREVATLSDANVVSSQRIGSGVLGIPRRHAVLLDIDYPAYLVESSTPGHFHLYLDVPGRGVEHEDYMELLAVLAKCKIIEQGYADVSIARGHSDLRLPWVSKDDQVVHSPNEVDVDLKTVPAPVSIDDPWGF